MQSQKRRRRSDSNIMVKILLNSQNKNLSSELRSDTSLIGIGAFLPAFSLVEALVVMTIAAIFVAVIASVVPHKAKPKISAEAHGGYECYWVGDKLYSRMITLGHEGEAKEETGDHCVFRPNKYVPYLIINAVGGGASGGSDNGGNAGQFTSAFFPIPQTSYNIYPGKGGTSDDPDGKPTRVDVGSETILEVSGGNDAVAIGNTKVTDIVDVLPYGNNMVDGFYDCNFTPRASLEADNLIHVTYCKDKSANIVEQTFEYENSEYNNDKDRYKTIRTSPVASDSNAKVLSQRKEGTVDTWEYYDVGVLLSLPGGYDPLNLPDGCTYNKLIAMNDPMCPSRFKIEIKLNIPENGEDGAVSPLSKYAGLMQYTELIDIQPGNGGAIPSKDGKSGAVLISW